MSRYVSVPLDVRRREELTAALEALKVPHEEGQHDRILLDGSLECAGEPVDIRVGPGLAGSSEDFGFVRDPDGSFRLVCGDADRTPLTRNLVVPLAAEIARRRVLQATDTTLEEQTEADGTRRLLVRTRGEGG